MMRLRHDHAILVLALALLVIGLGMVFSASHELARTKFDDSFFFLKRQLFRSLVGIVAMLVASQVDFRQWRRLARPGLLVACSGLAVVFLFNEIRGARGWVQIMGRTLQPVEFARLALVCFLAAEIARLGPRVRSLREVLPLGAVIAVVLALVLAQPDFGSGMALALICLTLLFVGGARLVHLGSAAAAAFAAAAFVAWQKPHVQARVLGFLQPDAHASGDAYQSLQSVMSIGAGGPFGKGLGQGFAKYGYLPDPHTDFIFSVMGEELGFIGCAVVLVLFLLLVARAIRVARAHEDAFARLLAIGIGMSLFWYATINVMVALRLFPVTGLPLPLVSYGGSALTSHLFALGILRNLALQAESETGPRLRFRVPQRHAAEAVL